MKIGFIGMGNMAKAILKGILDAGKAKAEDLSAYAPHREKLLRNAAEYQFTPAESLRELVSRSELLIMACKPYQVEAVLRELDGLLSGKVLISIAASWNFDTYRKVLGDSVRIQCIMPNTPAMVREGVLLFEEKNSLKEEELSYVKDLFGALGMIEVLPTALMGIAETVTGCGPAYADMFMEAYADAAVRYGLPRELSYRLVAKMLQGSAKLLLETGKHPGVLKDEVCSPGGYTIRGVEALEKAGFRGDIMELVAAVQKKREE